MSPPRDERGRFTSRPVLHRQVPEPCADTAEWLQLTEPREVPDRGARWAWALLVMALALVIVAMLVHMNGVGL